MSMISSDDIQDLVTKSFVLEAITEKPGCTSRYEDLPGKPLQDFIVAGINSSRYFTSLARDFKNDTSVSIFKYNLAALKNSNKHKSSKYINFGLLEVMFLAVYARLKTDNPSKIISSMVEEIRNTSNKDVNYLLKTRELAWSTSITQHKINFAPDKYKKLESVWDFYDKLHSDFGVESSNFQWAEQYKKGLPILKAFFDAYTKNGEVINTTKLIFKIQRAKNPLVAVGILADMCAAAVFLWLSFNEAPV